MTDNHDNFTNSLYINAIMYDKEQIKKMVTKKLLK